MRINIRKNGVFEEAVIKGIQGDVGPVGPVGPQGQQGIQGPPGVNSLTMGMEALGFTNGHIFYNNNGALGAKALTASDVNALALSGGEINGDLNVNGTLIATRVYGAVYNDYAEYFEKKDVNEYTEPGDIIVLDNDRYTKSSGSYNKMVIGVHSDSYGHILGGKGDGSEEIECIPIGLAGRVLVKVIGEVKQGDLIVTSDIDGVGMVGREYIPGTVIGKAVEDKNSQEIGKVKVLIMLS